MRYAAREANQHKRTRAVYMGPICLGGCANGNILCDCIAHRVLCHGTLFPVPGDLSLGTYGGAFLIIGIVALVSTLAARAQLVHALLSA